MMARYDALNPEAFQRLVGQGVQVHPFPNDMMQAAQDIALDLLESENTEPSYTKIYTAFKKWRDDSYRWFSTAEQTYAAFAYGNINGAGQTL